MYEQERLRTHDSASAVALSAYSCSPDHIRSTVLSGLERHQRLPRPRRQAQACMTLLSWMMLVPLFHLPLGLHRGLSCFQARFHRGRRPNSWHPLAGKPNPLLGGGSAIPSSTSRGLASSLFPRSGVATDRKHLWSGLSNKAGAAFGEALDAIDGIRRSQEAEKTGTKGTLASIQEGERLDVFLALGCGELTVELCLRGIWQRAVSLD